MQSGRFEVMTDSGYCDFKGIAYGKSANELYDVDGELFTEDHTFVINGTLNNAKYIGTKTDKKDIVYELLHVNNLEHTYLSYGSDENSLCTKNNKNCLVLDEFAFLDKGANSSLADEFIKSVFPTISSAKDKKNSKIIVISTPNGMNAFYRIWSKALVGKNDFIPYKIDWRKVPRSVSPEDFKDNQVNIIGELAFKQEYECVAEDTLITLKNEDTGEIIKLTMAEAEQLLENIIDEE
jgi:hypothetical protein